MSEEILKDLEKSIIKFFDKNGEPIVFSTVKIMVEEHPSYHSKGHVLRLYVDDKPFSINKKKVSYQCSCGKEHTIWLKKFLAKTRLRCNSCSEDEEKRMNHSRFFKDGYKKGRQVKLNQYDFDSETDNFKEQYYQRHLTEQEFMKDMLPHIYSINGVEINDGMEVKYLEHEQVKNQFKYFPYVLINGEKKAFMNIAVKCPMCGKHYTVSDRRRKRDKIINKCICRDCSFTNMRYPIINYKTKFNDEITYQSQLELKFIEYCENQNIRILDGFNIDYYWGNSPRTYHVDFYLPDKKEMIEVKGNHIWHKNQIKNGKWGAKEKAAQEFAQNHGYVYKILFEEDIEILTVNDIV